MNEGRWIWTDGSLLEGYTPWGGDNPNNLRGNQNCGHIVKGTVDLGSFHLTGFEDGEWNDFKCDFPLGYICEKKNIF